MTRVHRKPVSLRVMITVPAYLSAAQAANELRAKLQGYGGHRTFYRVKGQQRHFDSDGGMKVIGVRKERS